MGAPSGPQLVVGGGTQRLDGGRQAWRSCGWLTAASRANNFSKFILLDYLNINRAVVIRVVQSKDNRFN